MKEAKMEKSEELKRIPEEFVAVKRFSAWDGDNLVEYGYPVFIKNSVCYDSEENVGEVTSFENLECYYGSEDGDSYEIPSSISDLEELAIWLLDGWTEMIYEDGYVVRDYKFIVDFWEPEEKIFSKEIFDR